MPAPFTDIDYSAAGSGAVIGAVSVSAAGGTLTDRSGTITAGGTSQQLAAANAARRFLLVVNISGGDLWVNFGVAAVVNQPSVKVAPGDLQMWSPATTGVVPTGAVNIIGATTAQAFTAKEA